MSRCTYIAIDLKSFYASVECADRQLDPLTTNLVVAYQSRTDKTICLAVSPALKACGDGLSLAQLTEGLPDSWQEQCKKLGFLSVK